MTTRILIADDHPVILNGLSQILDGRSDMTVAGQAQSGREVLDKVHEEEFDLVILDIAMPDLSGVEVLGRLSHLRPKLPVLILSMHREKDYALRVLESGASGYLAKGCETTELIRAIKKIVSGGVYISPELAEELAVKGGREQLDKPLHALLSDREHEVLMRIASGDPIREIAKELGVSAKTVSTYRSRILQKMGLKSNAELIRYAIKEKIIV